MFRFENEQKVFEIAGVKVGGQPGEYPTVLVGSIFYEGHKIVSEPFKGEFDQGCAESLIKRQEELSDKTGNPFILDVVGLKSEALRKCVDFVAEKTKAPFLVDGPSYEVRIPVIKHTIETGLRDRAIYNSIDYSVKPEEITSLKELNVRSSVLMAYNPRNVWAEGRLEILKGFERQIGLLEAGQKAGLENLLVDTAVLDVPSIGFAAKAINLVKSTYGLPAGCAPANAVTTWKKLKKEYPPSAYLSCIAGSMVITNMMGANFILYGPVELAEAAFPACAMADAIIAYGARRLGTRPKVSNHPLFKIF